MAANKLTAVEEIAKLTKEFHGEIKKRQELANIDLACSIQGVTRQVVDMDGQVVFDGNVSKALLELGIALGIDSTPTPIARESSIPKKRVKKEEKQKHWANFIKGLKDKTFTLPELNDYMEKEEPLYEGNIDAFMKPITAPLLKNNTLTKTAPKTGNKLIKVWTIK